MTEALESQEPAATGEFPVETIALGPWPFRMDATSIRKFLEQEVKEQVSLYQIL